MEDDKVQLLPVPDVPLLSDCSFEGYVWIFCVSKMAWNLVKEGFVEVEYFPHPHRHSVPIIDGRVMVSKKFLEQTPPEGKEFVILFWSKNSPAVCALIRDAKRAFAGIEMLSVCREFVEENIFKMEKANYLDLDSMHNNNDNDEEKDQGEKEKEELENIRPEGNMIVPPSSLAEFVCKIMSLGLTLREAMEVTKIVARSPEMGYIRKWHRRARNKYFSNLDYSKIVPVARPFDVEEIGPILQRLYVPPDQSVAGYKRIHIGEGQNTSSEESQDDSEEEDNVKEQKIQDELKKMLASDAPMDLRGTKWVPLVKAVSSRSRDSTEMVEVLACCNAGVKLQERVEKEGMTTEMRQNLARFFCDLSSSMLRLKKFFQANEKTRVNWKGIIHDRTGIALTTVYHLTTFGQFLDPTDKKNFFEGLRQVLTTRRIFSWWWLSVHAKVKQMRAIRADVQKIWREKKWIY